MTARVVGVIGPLDRPDGDVEPQAIKILPSTDPELRARLERTAKAIADHACERPVALHGRAQLADRTQQTASALGDYCGI